MIIATNVSALKGAVRDLNDCIAILLNGLRGQRCDILNRTLSPRSEVGTLEELRRRLTIVKHNVVPSRPSIFVAQRTVNLEQLLTACTAC